jgi:EpsI family protein
VNNAQSKHGWGLAGLSIAVLLLLVLGLYRETTLYLGRLWVQGDGGYGHGFLVLAISLYIVFRQRNVLSELVPCPSSMALYAVATFSLIWLVATLVDVQIMQSAVLLLLVLSVIWAAAGGRVAWQLSFPVMFVAFALPLWSPLLLFLRPVTAEAAFWMTRAAGVPALLQDFVVILPAGSLKISEACSGLHYLLAALTLGVFYAYLNYPLLWQRVMVVMVAAAAAILANILRVFIVIYLAWTSDMQHPLVADHLSLGWYLFAGLVLVLLLVDAGLHRNANKPRRDATAYAQPAVTGACKHGALQNIILLIITALLTASGPALAWWMEQQGEVSQNTVLVFPGPFGDWTGPSETLDTWMPAYQGAIAEKRAYRTSTQELYLYIGYYPAQSQGNELISDVNRISDVKTWRAESSQRVVTTSRHKKVIEQVLESPAGQQRLVWYWYCIGDNCTTNAYMGKLLQVLGFVTGKREALVIAVAQDIRSSVDDVRKVLDNFSTHIQLPLTRYVNAPD